MPRMDELENVDLKTLLISLSVGRLTKGDIYSALGWDRQKYSRESGKDDFPTAEHIDTLAEHIDLPEVCGITAARLKARFGIVTPDLIPRLEADLEEYKEMFNSPTTLTKQRGVGVRRRRPRADLNQPPL